MPTPSDDTLFDVSPPTAISATHTTCPPEEDRGSQSSPTDSHDGTFSTNVNLHNAASSHARISSPDTPDGFAGSAENMPSPDASLKSGTDTEEPGIGTREASSALPEGLKESDARLAHSMSATTISPSCLPAHLGPPLASKRLLPNSSSSFLRPGSKFHGTQQSDRQTYDVQVEIKHVDMDESYLCGYLRIRGLTEDHPTLTTYFEGEIIGTKYMFKTAHPDWGSTEKVDMQHWARFPAWKPLAKQARSPNFNFKNFAQREHLFMRWKEHFLVPDHKVKSISGASFEGFYYICFNQCTGVVSGIYFHSRSEKYQQLELTHVDDRGCMGAMEFR